MRRTEVLQGIRRMKFAELLGRVERRELRQAEAAEVLGMSERTFRRWRDRYEAEGAEGLLDGRLGKVSARRVAVDRRARAGKRGGFGKASEAALRTGRELTTVPMFILGPQVTVRKRLDVSGATQKWIAELPRLVARNWREPVRTAH